MLEFDFKQEVLHLYGDTSFISTKEGAEMMAIGGLISIDRTGLIFSS